MTTTDKSAAKNTLRFAKLRAWLSKTPSKAFASLTLKLKLAFFSWSLTLRVKIQQIRKKCRRVVKLWLRKMNLR